MRIRLRFPLFAPVISHLKSFIVLFQLIFKAQVCWSDENPQCVFTAVSSPSFPTHLQPDSVAGEIVENYQKHVENNQNWNFHSPFS